MAATNYSTKFKNLVRTAATNYSTKFKNKASSRWRQLITVQNLEIKPHPDGGY